MANGIYSQFPPLKRITAKIEKIIREEMDALDGQECIVSGSTSREVCGKSPGRFESVGSELLYRFKDRNNAQMVLGMTHEEAAVHLVRASMRTVIPNTHL